MAFCFLVPPDRAQGAADRGPWATAPPSSLRGHHLQALSLFIQGIGRGFPKCRRCCQSPRKPVRPFCKAGVTDLNTLGATHTAVCAAKDVMVVGDTDETHGEVPRARLGHPLPSPQSRELYIGSSIPVSRERGHLPGRRSPMG